MRERHIEDWLVFKCLGCNTEPFALHSIKREDRVLVNGNIQVLMVFKYRNTTDSGQPTSPVK